MKSKTPKGSAYIKEAIEGIKLPGPESPPIKEILEMATGARRGSSVAGDKPGGFPARWDLLLRSRGLRRLAETFGEGALKYGDDNWLKGIDAKNLMNHSLAHIFQWIAGDNSEDHLSHATWGLMAIMHFEETRPDMINFSERMGHDGFIKVFGVSPEIFRITPSKRSSKKKKATKS